MLGRDPGGLQDASTPCRLRHTLVLQQLSFLAPASRRRLTGRPSIQPLRSPKTTCAVGSEHPGANNASLSLWVSGRRHLMSSCGDGGHLIPFSHLVARRVPEIELRSSVYSGSADLPVLYLTKLLRGLNLVSSCLSQLIPLNWDYKPVSLGLIYTEL